MEQSLLLSFLLLALQVQSASLAPGFLLIEYIACRPASTASELILLFYLQECRNNILHHL
jgi:hypothetical protein